MDDFIVLGRATPERMENGRTTVCTAGYSPNYGFLRIYPTRMDTPLHWWDIIRVPLERNPQDARKESWKIEGAKGEWDKLNEKIEVLKKLPLSDRLTLIDNLVDGCINDINEAKRSLGIVKPMIEKCYFSKQDEYDTLTQMTLLGRPLPKVREQYPMMPRIKYRCSCCNAKGAHDQQVLEWGFYEWIRKNPDKKDQVWDNVRISSKAHKIYFFVGNVFRYQSSFMIISVLRLPKGSITKSLFPLKKF